jgi:adenylate kinase family enzyme
MRRIAVIGVTGSGKTTLAKQIAARLNIPHIESDALHWEPNWQEASLEVFRQRMSAALDPTGCWVCDGNYSKVRDIIWNRADTIIWLDYPLYFSLWRLLIRTFRRILLRESLWGTNHETIKGSFFDNESLMVWAVKSQRKHRTTYPTLLASPDYAHINSVRLLSPKQTNCWLRTLPVVDSQC